MELSEGHLTLGFEERVPTRQFTPQFEQWLHAKRTEESTELVQALRQCDGGRLQCLVLVRGDFWLAVSRFMQVLEIRVVEGENSRLVDLFDPRHARKVLMAFGKAFGALPEQEKGLTKDQEVFLDQAVAGLAEEGKVISVRLALFAEMVKGKPEWERCSIELLRPELAGHPAEVETQGLDERLLHQVSEEVIGCLPSSGPSATAGSQVPTRSCSAARSTRADSLTAGGVVSRRDILEADDATWANVGGTNATSASEGEPRFRPLPSSAGSLARECARSAGRSAGGQHGGEGT